jgi:hypothetical protein
VLLLVATGFMTWRALETWRTAAGPGLAPDGARLLSRIALVEGILAGLALLTAVVALVSLRRRPRQQSLHLAPSAPADPAGAGGPDDEGPRAA